MTTTLGHQWRGDYVGNSNESPLPSSQSGTIKRPIKKPKLLLLPSRKRSLSLSLGCQGRPSRKPGLRPHPGHAPPLLQWQGLTRPVITGDISKHKTLLFLLLFVHLSPFSHHRFPLPHPHPSPSHNIQINRLHLKTIYSTKNQENVNMNGKRPSIDSKSKMTQMLTTWQEFKSSHYKID